MAVRLPRLIIAICYVIPDGSKITSINYCHMLCNTDGSEITSINYCHMLCCKIEKERRYEAVLIEWLG